MKKYSIEFINQHMKTFNNELNEDIKNYLNTIINNTVINTNNNNNSSFNKLNHYITKQIMKSKMII